MVDAKKQYDFGFLKRVIPVTLCDMTNSSRFFILSCSVLALSACGHPNAMPSGYTHHHAQYKSPDATPALSSTGALGTIETTPVRLSQMDVDIAVDDLLRKITARAGVSPKPVYIMTPSNMGGFYNVVDSALRKNMRDLGYATSDTTEGVYAFAYSAREIRKPRGSENDGYPNVEMTLQVFGDASQGAKLLTEQTGNYFIAGASNQNIQPATKTAYQNFNVAPVEVPVASSVNAEPVIEVPVTRHTDIVVKETTPSSVSKPMTATVRTQLPSRVSKSVGTKDDIIIMNSQADVSSEVPKMIDQGPIVPEIEFKSLSGSSFGASSAGNVSGREADSYGEKPILNDTPSLKSGRVSKSVDY